MSAASVGIAVAIIGVLGGLITVLLKNNRNSPERRTADSMAWNLLNGGLQKEVERMGLRLASQDTKIDDQDSKILTLQSNVDRLHGVELTLNAAVIYIHTLIGIIKTLGQVPPDPPEGLNVAVDDPPRTPGA